MSSTKDAEITSDSETASLPRVNLLPASIRQSVRISILIKRVLVAALGLMLAAAAIWLMQASTIKQAQQGLDQAQLNNQKLNAQVSALSPIGELYSALTRQQEFVEETLASSPQASEIIKRLQQAATDTGQAPVAITSTSISYHGIPRSGESLNPCPNPDPFNESITIGCLSFNATANTRDQISLFLNNIATDQLFVGAFVSSSIVSPPVTDGDKANEDQVTFSGSAGISLDGLRKKLTPEQISALTVAEPESSPQTATDPSSTPEEVE